MRAWGRGVHPFQCVMQGRGPILVFVALVFLLGAGAAQAQIIPCTNDIECDDGFFCNGVEECGVRGECDTGPGDPCGATETCSEMTQTCDGSTGCTNDIECDDGFFCTGVEECGVGGECDPGPGDPCGAGETCNEPTASCGGVVPFLEVFSSSNPIVDGIVEFAPGDTDVSITFGIVPDAGVTKYDAFFLTSDEGITVDGCMRVDDQSFAVCPAGGMEFAFTFPEFAPPMTGPFDIGTAMISVASDVTAGDAFATTEFQQTASFIQEGTIVTPIGGQVFGIVIPEPSPVLMNLVALGAIAGLARMRRRFMRFASESDGVRPAPCRIPPSQ
jgi:hypothetical protein